MEEHEDHEKLDYTNPGIIMGFVIAFMSDASFIFLIAVLVPGVGLVIGAMVALGHYFAGILVGGLIMTQLKHFMPKLVVGSAILLPLPLLTVSILLAIVMQNRAIEFLIIQGADVAVGAVTGGVGTVVGEVATAAEVGGTAAEIGSAATTAAKGATGVQRAGRAGWQGVKEGARLADARGEQEELENLDPEMFGEERPILGEEGSLRKDLLEKIPSNEDNREEEGVMVDDKENTVDLRKAA